MKTLISLALVASLAGVGTYASAQTNPTPNMNGATDPSTGMSPQGGKAKSATNHKAGTIGGSGGDSGSGSNGGNGGAGGAAGNGSGSGAGNGSGNGSSGGGSGAGGSGGSGGGSGGGK